MSENQASQKQESGKVKKAFEANMRKLTGLLKGEAYFKQPKANGEELQEAIAVLAKEEKEDMIKKIVSEARKLIQEKRDFDRFVNAQRKELDKKVEGKQKEFNEKAKVLFGMVKDVGALEKEYADTLKNAVSGKENVVPEPDEEDPEE